LALSDRECQEDATVPTYQYACTACGEQLEAVQSFTDAALTDCPACGGALRKVYSAVGVVFKGSGFYKTDSRKTAGSTAKSDGAKSDGAKSEGTKSDTAAPAAKSGDSASSTTSTTSTTSTPAAKSA
jgi:putative FmdB family regulatory protein